MKREVYCRCSNCKNRELHIINANEQANFAIKIEVCKNSREVFIYYTPSDTLRSTCVNYVPKENKDE